MNFWDKIVNFFKGASKIVPVLVTMASVATAVIPNPTPQTSAILNAVHQVLDIVALNVANNTPAQ